MASDELEEQRLLRAINRGGGEKVGERHRGVREREREEILEKNRIRKLRKG